MNYSNKYASKVDFFEAPDMYNLVMPAVPPADLTIAAGGIVSTYLSFRNSASSRVVDFDPRDNPYCRSLTLTSNLADGLVDAAVAHFGGASSWQVVLRPQRVTSATAGVTGNMRGTITNVAGSATITGVGTLFTQDLAVGATIVWADENGVQRSGVVSALDLVTPDTVLTLTGVTASTGMFTANTTANVFAMLVGQAGYAGSSITLSFLQMNTPYPFAFFIATASLLVTPRGKITTVAGSAAVTGIGTKFLTDMPIVNGALGVGYVMGWIDDLGVRRTGVVLTVNSDTSITLQAVVVATGGATAVPMLNLDGAIRIRAEMPYTFLAYTITIDPAFGTRRMSLAVMAEIEHTFGMTGAL